MTGNRTPNLTTIKESSFFCYACGHDKRSKEKKPCPNAVDGRHTYTRRYQVDLKAVFGGKP